MVKPHQSKPHTLKVFFFNVMCMCVFAYVYVFLSCALGSGIRSHGTEITDNCEVLCGCYELNPGLLQGQQMLLTPSPVPNFPHF